MYRIVFALAAIWIATAPVAAQEQPAAQSQPRAADEAATNQQRSSQQRERQRPNQPRPNQRAQRQQRAPLPPTHADVQYGSHRRQVMDVWLADASKPTPLLVSIHGGGFRNGDKSIAPEILKACLDSGISVAAITYRLSNVAKAPAQFHDCARAIQFLRHNAQAWNLDPSRIACIGGSAGAGLSMWLGFHDDLAQQDSDDPVLKQSSRITCASVYNGQCSYDPRFIRELFPGTDTYKHSALAQLYDVNLDQLDNLPDEKYRLFEETSALPHVSRDDIPVLMCYASDYDTPILNQGIGIHHPKFGKVLKEKMDKVGLECQVHTACNRGEWGRLTIEFVKKQFGMADTD